MSGPMCGPSRRGPSGWSACGGHVAAAVVLALCSVVSTGCQERRQGPERDDAVARQVTEKVREHTGISPQVEVTVEEGVAYLEGDVDEGSQKAEAARAAKEVDGVVDVVNKVHVQP